MAEERGDVTAAMHGVQNQHHMSSGADLREESYNEQG
jgi:hypothetical protein